MGARAAEGFLTFGAATNDQSCEHISRIRWNVPGRALTNRMSAAPSALAGNADRVGAGHRLLKTLLKLALGFVFRTFMRGFVRYVRIGAALFRCRMNHARSPTSCCRNGSAARHSDADAVMPKQENHDDDDDEDPNKAVTAAASHITPIPPPPPKKYILPKISSPTPLAWAGLIGRYCFGRACLGTSRLR